MVSGRGCVGRGGFAVFLVLLMVFPMVSWAGSETVVEKDGGLLDSAWPMFHHDLKHTGRSPYAPAISNWYVVKWKFKMYGYTTSSSPAIDKNGTIYVGSFRDGLFALYPNGTPKWQADIGQVLSSPAIGDDGTIYVGNDGGRLYAFNPNGTIRWDILLGAGWAYSSPAIGLNGIIYTATTDEYSLFAIYPNGTIKWRFQVATGPIYSSPAIADDGTIYIGSNDDYLYAVNPNGTLKWKFKATWCIQNPPSIDDNCNIYFGSWDGYLYSLRPNGTLRWKYWIGSNEASPAIAADGTIITGSADIFAFSPNGSLKWRFQGVGGDILGSPVIDANGIIYAPSGHNDFFAINPNGTLRWRFVIANCGIQSTPAIAQDGTIYITGGFEASGANPDYSYLYALGCINDTQPSTPTITGTENGHVRRTYDYTITAIDPDNDTLQYYIDWGDGTFTNWTTPTPSGHSITQSHTWKKRGTYTVKAKARDQYLWETDWATLTVKMPYEPPRFPILHWLLDRFPNAFPFLRHLLQNLPQYNNPYS